MSTQTKATAIKPLGAYSAHTRAGDLIFVSGMSARQADGSIAGAFVGSDGRLCCDIRMQTRVVIEKIAEALADAGAGLQDCVAITSYLVDMRDFDAYNQVYGEYFKDSAPSRTTVAVYQLPHPHMVIELTAVACKPAADAAKKE